LRRGELRALRWRNVDLAGGAIRIEESASCDEPEPGDVKTSSGKRTVPIIAALRDHLIEHRMSVEISTPDAYVFGDGLVPFSSSTVRRRAARAWRAAGLKPTQLHAARHTFASILIAAGVNAKALTVYMGHASLSTTHDLYCHLMRGSEDEAIALVDAYLARSASTDAPVLRQSDPQTTANNRTEPDSPVTGNPCTRATFRVTTPNKRSPRPIVNEWGQIAQTEHGAAVILHELAAILRAGRAVRQRRDPRAPGGYGWEPLSSLMAGPKGSTPCESPL
jgi:hypothetical protein